MPKTLLSLCSGTGAWEKPYADAGWNVISVTWPENDARLWPSKPSSTPRFPREFESVEDLPKIHGILAAPVCTVFSGAGAKHPRSDAEILDGLSLVDACIRLVHVIQPDFWVLENPIGKLRKWLGPPKYSFDPCFYAGYADDPIKEAYTKKTLLWGDFNIPTMKFVEPVLGSKILQYGGKSDRTKELRSITPSGFARAFYEANH